MNRPLSRPIYPDDYLNEALRPDPELRALSTIVREMRPLDKDAQRRVIEYLFSRYPEETQ